MGAIVKDSGRPENPEFPDLEKTRTAFGGKKRTKKTIQTANENSLRILRIYERDELNK